MILCCILVCFSVATTVIATQKNEASGRQSGFSCAYTVSAKLPTSFEVKDGVDSAGMLNNDSSVITCSEGYDHCMTFWSFNPVENETIVLIQGCWKATLCSNNCTADRKIDNQYINNSYFCCCSTSMCNTQFEMSIINTDLKSSSNNSTGLIETELPYTLIITCGIGACCILFVSIVVIAFCYRRRRSKLMKNTVCDENGEKNSLLPQGYGMFGNKTAQNGSENICGDNFDLIEKIGSGRFGLVWLARHKQSGNPIAVKVFNPEHYLIFTNELATYGLLKMGHPNVIGCFGASEEYTKEGHRTFWLCVEYMERGTLQAHLKSVTLNWLEMCRLASSCASGLNFLHTEVSSNGYTKPPIAHRDLNSRNILVKPDGTCCLCDFGFAKVLEMSNLKKDSSDEVSLEEVGTMRYKAPEILEGAVNLSDPESALKQIDVYAFGLCLWEIVRRCRDVYEPIGESVPEYEVPYLKEAGKCPTFEQMRVAVCQRKSRPLLPKLLEKCSDKCYRNLRILIEDLWDHEADARISSTCAHQRLIELQNATPGKAKELRLRSPRSPAVNNNASIRHLPITADSSNASSGLGGSIVTANNFESDRSNSPASCTESTNAASLDSPVQPYLGLNQTMARNLQQDSSDESTAETKIAMKSNCKKVDPLELMNLPSKNDSILPLINSKV